MKQSDYKPTKKPTKCPYCMGNNIISIQGLNMWQCITTDTCLMKFMEKTE